MNALERQIQGGESATVEFLGKAESFEAVLETVVAFLNTRGGYVYIGVQDDGQIIGVPNAEKAASSIYSRLQEAISPKALFSVAADTAQGKAIVVVEVPGAKDTPFVADGILFLRKGTRNARATGEDLQSLLQSRSVETERWERRGSPVLMVEDLDRKELDCIVEDARTNQRFSFRSPGNPEAMLIDLGMWTRGMLTHASDICFGARPAIRHPQARLRAFAFESDKGGNYIDQADISGPVVQVIHQAHAFITRNSPLTAQFSSASLRRRDQFAYPAEAIREGLVNSLAHRDYAAFSSGATVTLYPDRLEIWNSGSLPKGWKEDRLRHNHPSLPPNPDIAHVLFIRGLMERIGRGTIKIIEACRTASIPAPRWKVDDAGITLVLFSRASNHAPDAKLNERQVLLLETLVPEQKISSAEYAERFAKGVVQRQARRDLIELEDADLLRREGKGKATVYMRTQREWKP
jgi:ATP-dependent DNA helicase RecG